MRQHREPAELVGDRTRHEDQRTEREQVAVQHPLLQGQSATQVTADGRQREVDHGTVEEGHERGQYGNRDQRPIGVAPQWASD
ncbi:hypothetical protein ABGB19_04490 [Mycobacterium sp. B14F4]|uniref:hypothetical protein n=1 Tax=Mycobacterium sp. B14F4 TaxID=3153565 RepID=UPI00325D89C0